MMISLSVCHMGSLIMSNGCMKHQICHNNSSKVHVRIKICHPCFAIGETHQIKQISDLLGDTQLRIRL